MPSLLEAFAAIIHDRVPLPRPVGGDERSREEEKEEALPTHEPDTSVEEKLEEKKREKEEEKWATIALEAQQAEPSSLRSRAGLLRRGPSQSSNPSRPKPPLRLLHPLTFFFFFYPDLTRGAHWSLTQCR